MELTDFERRDTLLSLHTVSLFSNLFKHDQALEECFARL
jgi:hypothetical protein